MNLGNIPGNIPSEHFLKNKFPEIHICNSRVFESNRLPLLNFKATISHWIHIDLKNHQYGLQKSRKLSCLLNMKRDSKDWSEIFFKLQSSTANNK